MDEVFSEFRWEPQEFIDASDAVVVTMRFHVETVSRGAGVYWFRDGKVVRYQQCQSRADALEAVGCGSRRCRVHTRVLPCIDADAFDALA
jgi:hypothetical protein